MQCQFLSPDDLTPTEETDPDHVNEVHYQIVSAGFWTVPVWVEKRKLFVMDGHHRLAAAIRLGLQTIPAILTDYQDVDVEAWRPGEIITAENIYAMVRSGRKFPVKTTRHSFLGKPPQCNIPLSQLGLRNVLLLEEVERRAGFNA